MEHYAAKAARLMRVVRQEKKWTQTRNDFTEFLKVFEIGLSWLCCEDEDSKAYTLLDDYGVWHTNY